MPAVCTTPTLLMNRYRKMSVKFDDNMAQILDVCEYLINLPDNQRAADAAVMWKQISNKMNEEVKSASIAAADWKKAKKIGPGPLKTTRLQIIKEIDPALDEGLVIAASLGKGSPEACKVFVRLAYRYGLVTIAGLKAFTQKYMGTDCSGFVSSYLVVLDKLAAKDVVNTSAISYRDPVANRRATLESVKALDVMSWAETNPAKQRNHVGLIETIPVAHQYGVPIPPPKGGGPRPPATATETTSTLDPNSQKPTLKMITEYTCTVVESNGGRGLGSETYTLVSVDAKCVFTVKRANGTKFFVYVVNRNL